MRKLKEININSILFLDIETAPQWQTLQQAPEHVKKEWIYKFKYRDGAPDDPVEMAKKNQNYDQKYFKDKYENYFSDLWLKQASFFPEFSRIICISVGYMAGSVLRIKSYFDENESLLLTKFNNDYSSFDAHVKGVRPLAHYGKGFDFPFIAKRMIIHRMNLPYSLDNYGLEPWKQLAIDTQEIWKVGGRGDSATIGSMAMAFGLPSPKDDIGGADVAKCYFNGEIDRIVKYCEKDMITLVNVFKFIRGEETLNENQVEFI